MNVSEIQKKLDAFIENSNTTGLREELQTLLQMDSLNTTYFLSLYKRFFEDNSDELPLFIHEENIKSSGDVLEVYPTAIANDELMKHLPVQNYQDLVLSGRKDSAKKASLWLKKMQAGTGSSMERKTYLAEHNKLDVNSVKLGAKGTDLYISLSNGKKISIAESQILQALASEKEQKIGKIIFHDIVSNETEESIEKIWNQSSLVNSDKSYKQLVDENPNTQLFGKSFQYHIPTLDEDGKISFNRKAPGGHALFGVDALLAAYKKEMRPDTGGNHLISSIGNGEDLSSSPDEYIISWMIDKKVPIAVVTTTKTSNDMKGGQIAIVPELDGTYSATIVEKAQAEVVKQLPLFESLGLREGDREAFFNTNMVVINYDVLVPMIEKLVSEVGEDQFLSTIAPALIQNNKKQIDDDGKERTYTQLEGAMVSSVLNLDKFWRKKYGEALVHFLNVDEINRTKFFCPIKTAFDFFMQFNSDRFAFDQKNFRLINLNPGSLPQVTLSDSSYKDVKTVLDHFNNCKIKHLKELVVSGTADFTNAELAGAIEVENGGDFVSILPFCDDGKIKDSRIQM